jgi:hypothetical protein
MTLLLVFLTAVSVAEDVPVSGEISAAAFPGIQAALAANPDKMVFVPAAKARSSRAIT